MAKEGTNIQAVKSGTVTHSGWLELGGWRLSIKDEEGLTHYYAHMMEKSMLKAGDKVNIGDVIGQVGSTGYSKTEGTKGKFDPHLHYGVYKNGKAINPTDYLKGATSIDSQNDGIKAYNKALHLPYIDTSYMYPFGYALRIPNRVIKKYNRRTKSFYFVEGKISKSFQLISFDTVDTAAMLS